MMTDANLCKLILLKSRSGAEEIYDRYAKALFLAIIRISPKKEIAELILEQVFIKAWHSFENYRPEKETLLAWMMSIAREMANDRVSVMLPVNRCIDKINDDIPNPGLIKSTYI